jgi:hypothetical protein
MPFALETHLHVGVEHIGRFRLSAYHRDRGRYIAAVLAAGGNRVTFSGPPAQVAELLRMLADKVDAAARDHGPRR